METVLREQFDAVKEEATQKLGVGAKELMQHFEGETFGVPHEMIATQQNEILSLR